MPTLSPPTFADALALAPTLAVDFSRVGLGLLVVLFMIISVAMILIVLVQRPQGGGLSGAFGAASEGAGQTAFGARTGDALTTATIVIFVLFLGIAITLNFAIRPSEIDTIDDAAQTTEQTTEEPATEGETGDTPAGASEPALPAGDGTFQMPELPGPSDTPDTPEQPDAPAGDTAP